jgi:hypothetical protein
VGEPLQSVDAHTVTPSTVVSAEGESAGPPAPRAPVQPTVATHVRAAHHTSDRALIEHLQWREEVHHVRHLKR